MSLGSGWTSGKFAADPPGHWAGSGWTGMPSIVVDGGRTYVIASGYDHRLRKIDAATGKVVWAYQFDDIIKSSPSVFKNPHPTGADDKLHRLRRARGAGTRSRSPTRRWPRTAPSRSAAARSSGVCRYR